MIGWLYFVALVLLFITWLTYGPLIFILLFSVISSGFLIGALIIYYVDKKKSR